MLIQEDEMRTEKERMTKGKMVGDKPRIIKQ